jgi:hypothetical protein
LAFRSEVRVRLVLTAAVASDGVVFLRINHFLQAPLAPYESADRSNQNYIFAREFYDGHGDGDAGAALAKADRSHASTRIRLAIVFEIRKALEGILGRPTEHHPFVDHLQ